jgi:hypothetical protein
MFQVVAAIAMYVLLYNKLKLHNPMFFLKNKEKFDYLTCDEMICFPNQ